MVLNVNVGILGHVDSGKTTLSRCLSTLGSTAAFDKNPQSKDRGITLDLGFSSFTVDSKCDLYDKVRFTLVDCPGHGSLIKTVIGGASIIDMMVLVIDVTKGIQPQTVECLVIGEIIYTHIVVVINKTDQLDEKERPDKIRKVKKMITEKVLKNIRCKSSQVVSCSARDGDVSQLMSIFENFDFLPDRTELEQRDFLMSVDHCFQVKGSGTVFTGTVLAGQVKIGDQIEVVHLMEEKKVKNIQIFKEKSESAKCGDRAAICVTQFDAKKVERGLVAKPKSLTSHSTVIIKLQRVKLYKEKILSNQRFHLTCGHQMATCKLTLFTPRDTDTLPCLNDEGVFEGSIFNYVPVLESEELTCLAQLEFDRPLYFLPSGLLIGSRLELDSNAVKTCRIAFSGTLQNASFYPPNKLQVLKDKSKTGTVERLHDPNTLIVKNLFKKETNFELFNRLKVQLSTGEEAIIDGTFGTTGKVKISNLNGFSEETQDKTRKAKKGEATEKRESITVTLQFCKNIFSSDKNSILQL